MNATEIVDYTNEQYSLGAFARPRISDPIPFSSSRPLSPMSSGPLSSMPSSPLSSEHSNSEFAQQHVSNSMPFSMRSRSSSSENSIPEMGLTNAFGRQTSQVPRQSFHRSLSQPFPTMWAMSGSMSDSSAEASESDSSQSYLRVAKEKDQKIEELTRANLILQTRLETLEGVLRFLAPSSLPPSQNNLAQACSRVAPLIASPFLPGPPFCNPTSSWATPSSLSDVLLKCDHYPNVKYWYRKDWLAHVKENGNSTDMTAIIRGKTLISKGINKTMLYIEDGEGKPVDGYRLRDIHAHAQAIWTHFQSICRLPTIWGRADAEIVGVYRREMRSKFFEFVLCENDWKADFLATESYPSWYSNHVKGPTVKGEAIDSPRMSNFKRPLTSEEPSGEPSKKAKVQNPLLARKLSIDTSIGNTGLLSPITIANSSTSVTVSPEPIPTSPGIVDQAISSLVVAQVDNEIGFDDESNNA